MYTSTVVPGFSVLGFSALPGFSALNPGDGAWSVHKTLFGFSAPVFQGKITFKAKKNRLFYYLKLTFSTTKTYFLGFLVAFH